MARKISRLGLVFAVASAHFFYLTPTSSAAYSFTSHTFTNCGQTGQNGPAQATCRSNYSTTWDDTDANFTVVNGIQIWTVPYTGLFRITALGAAGSGGSGTNGTSVGGNGAQVQGDFNLIEGDKIRILVGQIGTTTNATPGDGASGSGGGGSFVISGTSGTLDTQVLLIAAGGGGGNDPGYQASVTNGLGGIHTSSGTGDGENSGGSYRGSGTGGTNLNGGSFANGGAGGYYTRGDVGIGGFGGGGATDDAATGGGGWLGGTGSVAAYSKNNGSNQSGVSASNSSNGSVTIASLGPSITTFAPTSTLTNSTSLSFNLLFSQTVTGIDSSDFTVAGTGASTCVKGTTTGSGTTYTIPLTSCSQGAVYLTIAANVGTNTSSQTGPASITNSSSATIDLTAPTISTVTAPANKTYIPSETPTFTVSFSESVTVTGSPRLTLTVGSQTRYATYLSMSDSRTALFRYTVATTATDFDTDGIALSTTLDLNSGVIADLATNALTPLTFTAPTLTSVLVAQKPGAPTIDSISATSGQLSVNFTVGTTNGSSITNYEYSTNNGTNWTTRSPAATTSPIVIAGLTNGQTYPVRIRAVNGAGSGDSSTAVSGTPTAVQVAGGSNISIAYGGSGASSTFTATGGTGVYTFTLSSTPSGVSISNAIVSVDSTTAAGIYTLNVVATDNAGTPQSGSKQITITVSKATSSIAISLPGSATNAALGASVIITATVSRAGVVNFRLGGTTISGCGAATAATTTATCSWTAAALGGVSITAIFTPTESSNFETATTTTLSITVVNGVSTVTLSLTGGVTEVPKSQTINIIAAINQIGRVTFLLDGKRIPGCFNVLASVIGNKICSWKPTTQKAVTISARLVPTNSVYNPSIANLNVQVIRRSGTR